MRIPTNLFSVLVDNFRCLHAVRDGAGSGATRIFVALAIVFALVTAPTRQVAGQTTVQLKANAPEAARAANEARQQAAEAAERLEIAQEAAAQTAAAVEAAERQAGALSDADRAAIEKVRREGERANRRADEALAAVDELQQRFAWDRSGAYIGVAVVATAVAAWYAYSTPLSESFNLLFSPLTTFGMLWLYASMTALTTWGAAWLGSDLLSLRFAGNPDPLRAWRPAEFLARFAGRLAPPSGVVGVTALAAACWPLGYTDEWTTWLVVWTGITSLYIATGVSQAAVAALVSSLSRQPRRWLITLLVVSVSSLPFLALLSGGLSDWLIAFKSDGWRAWMFLTPRSLPWPALVRDPLQSYWAMLALPLAVSIVAGPWIWLIAARRYRHSRVSPDALERPASE